MFFQFVRFHLSDIALLDIFCFSQHVRKDLFLFFSFFWGGGAETINNIEPLLFSPQLDFDWACEWVRQLILTLEQKCQWRLKENSLPSCYKQKLLKAEGGYWTSHSSHQRIELLVPAVNRAPNQWWTNSKNSQQGLDSALKKRLSRDTLWSPSEQKLKMQKF